MISRPCRLLFLAVALAAGFFNSGYAQDTVPKETVDMFKCTGNLLNWNMYPIQPNTSACESVHVSSDSLHTSGSYNAEVNVDWSIQSGRWQKQWKMTSISQGTVSYNSVYMQTNPIATAVCPETHPIDNGDGTCSREPDDQACYDYAALHGSTGTDGQVKDLSVFGIFTPNKSGEVCKGLWSGLDDSHPEQTFCTYKLQGDGISLGNGEFSGRYVPSGGSCNPAPDNAEPPLDEPETDEECEERGYAVCAVDGQFLVSSSLIDGFCFHECSSSQPTPDPPPVSDVDADNNGIPDVNDPAHPDYDPDDPHSDPDNDGTPNYQDPTHPTYIGGGGTVANTEGTNVLLRQILDSQVVNNDLSITTNQLIAQQTQALGEKLDKLSSGGGGVVGGGDDGLWTDESATLEIETPDCTPDPTTGRCAEFGKLGVAALPEKTLDVSSYADDFTPIDTAATCPQEMPLTLGLGTFSFNTGPLCDVLSGIYYLVMFSAYYAVARIITRGATS
jgi:hypothetical protein